MHTQYQCTEYLFLTSNACIHTLTMNSLHITNLQEGVEVRVINANPMGTYAGDLRGLPGHGPGGLQVTATEC